MEHRTQPEGESFLSDSTLESQQDADDAPFKLPVSEVVRRSQRNTFVAVVAGTAAVVAAAQTPSGLVLDPLGIAAFAYIFFLFCFQNTFEEWPALDCRILLLLMSAAAAFAAPTVLHSQGLWAEQWVRAAAWIADALIIATGYRMMVRGPAYASLDSDSLEGKTFVVTGCNTGIGYETARTLAAAGATIVFACRSEDKARAAMKKIVEDSSGDIDDEQLVYVPLDTSSFASVRRFADLLGKTGLQPHTLILNAGVMLSNRTLSVDGLEMTIATNHYGHFLLVNLLLPQLLEMEAKGEQPRIVIVGSNMSYLHDRLDFSELQVVSKDDKQRDVYKKKPYDLFRTYGQSKLANLHFTTELARRLQARGSDIPVNQIHPGEVLTEVMRDMNPVVVKLNAIFRPVALGFMKSPQQGAFCTLHVATDPGLATSSDVTGAHFVRCSPAPLSDAGRDRDTAGRLWALSEEVTSEMSVV